MSLCLRFTKFGGQKTCFCLRLWGWKHVFFIESEAQTQGQSETKAKTSQSQAKPKAKEAARLTRVIIFSFVSNTNLLQERGKNSVVWPSIQCFFPCARNKISCHSNSIRPYTEDQRMSKVEGGADSALTWLRNHHPRTLLAGVCLRHLRAQPFLYGELVRGRTIQKASKYKERRDDKTARAKPINFSPGVKGPRSEVVKKRLFLTCSKVNIVQLTRTNENTFVGRE